MDGRPRTYATNSGTLFTRMTSPENTGHVKRFLSFPASDADVHIAIKQAYDYAKAHNLTGSEAHIANSINAHAVKILRSWHEAAAAQQNTQRRLAEQTNVYASRPLHTSVKGHNKVQAVVAPRPAQNVPSSRILTAQIPDNRSFAPAQLRQMRGVATSELEAYFN